MRPAVIVFRKCQCALQARVGPFVRVGVGVVDASDGSGEDLVRRVGYGGLDFGLVVGGNGGGGWHC